MKSGILINFVLCLEAMLPPSLAISQWHAFISVFVFLRIPLAFFSSYLC